MTGARRGRPLGFLASVVLGWTALRIAMLALPPGPAAAEPAVAATGSAPQRPTAGDAAFAQRSAKVWPVFERRVRSPRPGQTAPSRAFASPGPLAPALPPAPVRLEGRVSGIGAGEVAASATRLAPRAAPMPVAPLAEAGAGRWQVDAWLLLREDGPRASAAPRASYGAAQVGARLAFGLKPSSPHRPAAYVRAGKALTAGGETEVAAGLAARPLPALPITVHAELRATRFADATSLRPAAFATVQLDETLRAAPVRLRAYGQAGYVAGDHATPFADGQASIAGTLAVGQATLEAGGGVWAGGQEGAERLDAGPLVAAKIGAGQASVRVSAEYRIRVAGDAAPGSGPALTLSASF